MKRKSPEADFQKSLVRDLAAILPPSVWFCHIPNGGYRTKAEAGIFKAMGVRSGAPDLMFVHEGRVFFMELKAAKGNLTMNQIACKNQIRCAGATVETVRTLDEALNCLEIWNIPTRRKAAA